MKSSGSSAFCWTPINLIERGTIPMTRQHIQQEYAIEQEYYRGDIKRGLRNSDGTGVPIGVTKVGSVLGYMIEDGIRVPVPGQLYYRGIELNEIVEAHRKG